jgi:hypothetical protein
MVAVLDGVLVRESAEVYLMGAPESALEPSGNAVLFAFPRHKDVPAFSTCFRRKKMEESGNRPSGDQCRFPCGFLPGLP